VKYAAQIERRRIPNLVRRPWTRAELECNQDDSFPNPVRHPIRWCRKGLDTESDDIAVTAWHHPNGWRRLSV